MSAYDERPRSAGAHAARFTWRSLRWLARLLRGRYVEIVGGPARARVVALFGAVLALSGADSATVGAVAPQLESAMHISNTEIGLLGSVSLLVGAVFVIPVGMLVDRTKRMPLLAVSIVLWSVASLASAFSGSYSALLLSRLALGAVTATAGPAIASLTGDYFPANERGRVYSFILGGEVAGTAIGFIVSGNLGTLISWRAAFIVLAIPGFFLARTLWRTIPEPKRGGQSRLEPGVESFDVLPRTEPLTMSEAPTVEEELVRQHVRRRGIQPNPEHVLHDDPRRLGLMRAVRYMLSIPTNVHLIISSALGYFFFTGLQYFAVLFIHTHFAVGQGTADLVLVLLVVGAIIGTLISGRVTDALLQRGFLEARVWVPAICYIGAAVVFIPGVLIEHLSTAMWFDVAGAALVSAANPPLDAARLDIMPAGLWGRAESVRTLLRSLAQALAPVLFGALSDLVAGIFPTQTPVGTHVTRHAAGTATGLEVTFMVMLTTLAAAGIVLVLSRRTYAQDAASAGASHQGTAPR